MVSAHSGVSLFSCSQGFKGDPRPPGLQGKSGPPGVASYVRFIRMARDNANCLAAYQANGVIVTDYRGPTRRPACLLTSGSASSGFVPSAINRGNRPWASSTGSSVTALVDRLTAPAKMAAIFSRYPGSWDASGQTKLLQPGANGFHARADLALKFFTSHRARKAEPRKRRQIWLALHLPAVDVDRATVLGKSCGFRRQQPDENRIADAPFAAGKIARWSGVRGGCARPLSPIWR